jgi:hypothetical protein
MAKVTFDEEEEAVSFEVEELKSTVVQRAPTLALDAQPGAVVGRQMTEQEKAQEVLRTVQDDLFAESMRVTRDMLAFREIAPDATEPPIEWIAELGEKEARKRFNVARAAWLPGNAAPIGFKHATTMAVGIIRAKATEKSAPQNLNVMVVQLTEQPMMKYPEMEVEK